MIVLAGGCAPYIDQSRPALRAYYQGHFDEAADLIKGVSPRKADRLVAYLDKGTIFQAAGRYKKSIKFFTKAADLAETYYKQAALSHVGAVLTNDNVLPYIVDPYERLMIHAFLAMNYATIGNMEDALVEVRRIDTLFPKIYTDQEKRAHLKSAFVAYLMGWIWEGRQLCNDAYIDYKRVQKLKRGPKGLSNDLERTKRCAGLSSDNLPRSSKRPPNLMIVLESGRSPTKESSEYEHELQIIPVPVYKSRSHSGHRASILIDGRNVGATSPLDNVDRALRSALDDQMPAIIARALARLAVKTGAAVAVGKEVDENLGIFVGALLLATNRADLRSWRTLPHTMSVWRGWVTPGKHTISLDFLDKGGKKIGSVTEQVEVLNDQPELLIIRRIE